MKSIAVTWRQKKKLPNVRVNHMAAAQTGVATVRAVLDGTPPPHKYSLTPMPPSDTPGSCGTMVLVPTEDYYFTLIYVSGEEGPLDVDLPAVAGILVVDLPKGWLTAPAEITEAIQDDTGTGPPDRVGPP